MDAVLALLVVLVLLVAGIAALGRRMLVGYYARYTCTRHARALVSSVTFAPGDILFFNSGAHGFTNSAITRDYFSHAGIIVEDPATGALYVSDSSGSEVFPDADGVEYAIAAARAATVPLYTRIKYYAGEVYHARLVPGLAPAQVDRLWELARQRAPYPGLVESIARMAGLPWPAARRSRHCMGHVAWVVDSLGLTPAELLGRGKTLEDCGFIGVCRRVTGLPGQALGEGGQWHYSYPVHLLYDLDAIPHEEWEAWSRSKGSGSPPAGTVAAHG